MSKPADRRPDPKNYTKWEKPLPFSLEDFMTLYRQWKDDGVQHPEWKQAVVVEFEDGLKQRIKEHWKASSKTRKLFMSMNADAIWEDEKNHIMNLTKRNLATLDPAFIPALNSYILTRMSELIEPIRAEMRHVVEALYCTPDEATYVEEKILGSDPEHYTIDAFGRHLDLQAEMRKELQAKFAAIEYVRQREIFLQNLVNFEHTHKDTVNSPAKGQRNMLNWVAKFRIDASKILLESNAQTAKVIGEYEATTGKTFLLNSHKYADTHLATQKSQIARVKTNWSNLTADTLFFDDPNGQPAGNPIVGRLLDRSLQSIVDAGVPLYTPPAMPEFAQEVGFYFDYY